MLTALIKLQIVANSNDMLIVCISYGDKPNIYIGRDMFTTQTV